MSRTPTLPLQNGWSHNSTTYFQQNLKNWISFNPRRECRAQMCFLLENKGSETSIVGWQARYPVHHLHNCNRLTPVWAQKPTFERKNLWITVLSWHVMCTDDPYGVIKKFSSSLWLAQTDIWHPHQGWAGVHLKANQDLHFSIAGWQFGCIEKRGQILAQNAQNGLMSSLVANFCLQFRVFCVNPAASPFNHYGSQAQTEPLLYQAQSKLTGLKFNQTFQWISPSFR